MTVRRSRSCARRSMVLAKLPPRARVHPAGAQDEVLGARLLDELFAFQLGAAVHAQGAGVSVSTQGRAAAVEHVVGAVVHQPGAQGGGLAPARRGGGVEQAASSGSLSALSTAVCAAALTMTSGAGAHGGGNAFRLAKSPQWSVLSWSVQRHVTQHGQAALQLPADLAVLAQEQDVHATALAPALAWYCHPVAVGAGLHLRHPFRGCPDTTARSCGCRCQRSRQGRQPSSRSILRASMA